MMSQGFCVVKRSSVPNSGPPGDRPLAPKARLHKGGTLYLSVQAMQALSDQNCRLIAEFDEQASILRLTVATADKLPRGISLDDCFVLRTGAGKNNQRKLGMVSLKALLTYIGFRQPDASQELELAGFDREGRSISLVLPREQFSNGG